MHTHEVKFSQPDKYGEIHARLEMPLSIKEIQIQINLSINGKPAERYFFHYGDAGTVAYARMSGQYAIGGQLTNVSADWSKGAPEFGILHVVGTIDKGNAVLQIFKKSAEKLLQDSE